MYIPPFVEESHILLLTGKLILAAQLELGLVFIIDEIDGVKTLWTQDISAPSGQFGTDTSALVPNCLDFEQTFS